MLDEVAPAGEKILVVDDAPQNIKLLRVILKDAGYQVIEAANGPEALQKLKLERPDAMVLDVRMPGMTGYEVCEAVRNAPQFATLPVIMVTALSLPEERIRGIEAGATDIIFKPFNKKELLARIRTSLWLADAGRKTIVAPLPGAIVITDRDWKILEMSPPAAILLGVAIPSTAQVDFLQMLEQQGGALSAATDAMEPMAFHMQATLSHLPFYGKHTPVTDSAGRLILRVIVLSN